MIAMLLLFFVVVIVCWFAMDVSYVDKSGKTKVGPSAVSALRKEQKKWSGYLDEEKIRQVIMENRKIVSSPEYQSDNIRESQIAYNKGQGIMDIRNLLNHSFADGFCDYNYYQADKLTEELAPQFYKNRIRLLREWLDNEASEEYSDIEKEYLIRKYENIQTPFYYDYITGWSQLFDYAPTVVMITMLVLGYLVAGIFSNEFSWKTDTIFFTSLYGRNKATVAKIKAGFCVVTGIYLLTMLVYTGVTLLYLGAEGWSCPIQIVFSDWKSFYNIEVWQEYLLIVIGGYIGCLFISFLSMWVSAKTKSAVIAIIIPFVILFIPSFLGNINTPVINKILGLLPEQLLQIGNVLDYFNLYSFGNKVFGAVPILLVLYSLLAFVLVPIIYLEYQKK